MISRFRVYCQQPRAGLQDPSGAVKQPRWSARRLHRLIWILPLLGSTAVSIVGQIIVACVIEENCVVISKREVVVTQYVLHCKEDCPHQTPRSARSTQRQLLQHRLMPSLFQLNLSGLMLRNHDQAQKPGSLLRSPLVVDLR